jgi:hypothetical protein
MRALVFCSLFALGCNQDPGADNGKGDQKPATCPECPAPGYPPGSPGWSQGSTIPDASFKGFVDAQVSSGALQTIVLSDFYNPNGRDPLYAPGDPTNDDRLYPAGSPYGAGTKKPTALLIDISSLWCGPCKEEAKNVLPGKHARYRPCGGEFLVQIIDGPNAGTPATQPNLVTWTTAFKVDYPATIDPSHQLRGLYSGNTFPDLAIVDTTTMTIATVVAGLPDDTFWTSYESLLDGACLAVSK